MGAIDLRVTAFIGYNILIVAQVLLVWLWWDLTPLTDRPEGEVGTRLYALPHLLITAFGIPTIAALVLSNAGRTNKTR
jgi:hypothetical protein